MLLSTDSCRFSPAKGWASPPSCCTSPALIGVEEETVSDSDPKPPTPSDPSHLKHCASVGGFVFVGVCCKNQPMNFGVLFVAIKMDTFDFGLTERRVVFSASALHSRRMLRWQASASQSGSTVSRQRELNAERRLWLLLTSKRRLILKRERVCWDDR